MAMVYGTCEDCKGPCRTWRYTCIRERVGLCDACYANDEAMENVSDE